MLKTKNGIENWLKKYEIKNYTINNDLTVDVDGDVYLYYKKLKQIPIKFDIIKGYFNCSNNYLTSLDFCPKEVGGNFNCSWNELTSLEFCPIEIGGDFNCSWNELISLDGCPKSVGGDFYSNIFSDDEYRFHLIQIERKEFAETLNSTLSHKQDVKPNKRLKI